MAINEQDYIQKPNQVHLLRQMLQSNRNHSAQDKAELKAGFTTSFWKLLKKDIEQALFNVQAELEVAKDHFRLLQLQGEAAALREILNIEKITMLDVKKATPPIANGFGNPTL